MLQIERTIDIEAPVELVWKRITKLDDIQNWSRSVTKSHYHTAQQEGIGAGRTCEVQGFGTLIEEVVEWSENDTFTLTIQGMPRFVKDARGTWRLKKTGPNSTRATTTMSIRTGYGPLGALIEKFMLEPQLGKTVESIQAQFKHYTEQGNAADSESS